MAERDSSDNNPSGYVVERFGVRSSVSWTFRVRFQFDSVDGISNGFLGWHVDSVEVVAD